MRTVPKLIMILHIDMDAFFASIEQAINPKLKGKPLIVGTRNNKLYTVVCAASYEAKALGISSGMPSADAFRICPHLEFVAAQQSKYIWTSEQILNMLRNYGYELNYASIDEFQIDIADTNDPETLAKEIQKQIYANFKITASIGIARNCLLAKLASKLNKPNGIVILTPHNLEQVLAITPVKKLCGIGQKTEVLMQDLGVKTCLDLYHKTPGFLEQNLGKYGLNLNLGLHSIESLRTTCEEEKPKSVGHSYSLPRASENPGLIRAWIRLLSEMVGQRLRQQNLTSQTVHLWLSGPQSTGLNSQKTYSQATNDGHEIYARCLRILAKISLRMPRIRALGVTCSNLSQSSYLPLFREEKRRERLIKAVDSINTRQGEGAIYPAITILTRKIT